MTRTTKHVALGALFVGGAYCLWKRHENPAWTPWASLLASSRDRALALEKVKVTSVPTPHETAALDPGMSTDQVKQVNQSLSNETDLKKLANHAVALGALGHDNSAAALAAKTVAVADAKAQGAKDVDLHVKQVEAAAVPAVAAPVLPGAHAAGWWGGHGGYGHGWGHHGWEHREPWRWDRGIDPATGLPYVEEQLAPLVGFDRFARGGRGGREPLGFGRGGRGPLRHEFGRGFGRDPRFPRDRFAEELPYIEPWHHHHRHHHHPFQSPEAMEQQLYAQQWQQQYLQPGTEQQVVQQPAVQQEVDADADADVDATTATGWW